jgi:hypothetical protein
MEMPPASCSMRSEAFQKSNYYVRLGMSEENIIIQIDPHTLQRAEERGTDEQEIIDVIRSGFPIPAKRGRLGKTKVYRLERKRHGRY